MISSLAAWTLPMTVRRLASQDVSAGELWLTIETGKSKVINKAIQDIGMGRYQWELFMLCGFGWTADK